MKIQLKALLKFKHNDLIKQMTKDAILWHKNKQCDCMNDYVGKITAKTILPCKHLRDFQWEKYKKEINYLDKIHKKLRTLKLLRG